MKLMPLVKFRRLAFAEGCAPSPEKLRRMIAEGDIPGFQDSRRQWWVDFEAFERKISGSPDDPILDEIRRSA